jgi:PadR family transcriptional regulator, regulatory protein PadR
LALARAHQAVVARHRGRPRARVRSRFIWVIMAKTPEDSRLELLQGTLDMLILRTLQWGPQHGHGVGQAIRLQSEDLLKVETGSLYPALHRLEKRGWLKSEWGISEANQRAKFYQLTAAGKAQLSREQDRWSQLVSAIGRIMNPAENKG